MRPAADGECGGKYRSAGLTISLASPGYISAEMGIRAAIEVNKNTVFGPETNTYFVPCDGLGTLKKVRKNLTTAKDPAGLVKKLSTYVKKGKIRYDGRAKLTPQGCYPFIEYILRVNIVSESSFELEPVYETINKRQFACASNRSTTTFVKA